MFILKDVPDNFTQVEWQLINAYLLLLRPFASATERMRGEKYPTASSYIPVISIILQKCKDLIENNYAGDEYSEFVQYSLLARY